MNRFAVKTEPWDTPGLTTWGELKWLLIRTYWVRPLQTNVDVSTLLVLRLKRVPSNILISSVILLQLQTNVDVSTHLVLKLKRVQTN
ncbi:hypothetical protein J6590_100121 [Homalodisca vitripennis]|nr:hypothetical protein J6590_100121 [Homalodisca vitripennis]